MKPKIVFLVMSAVGKPQTVDQLAHALAPHLVLVHHDFAQTPSFPLTAPNVRFVPNPKRTGWAVFGFVEGIFHAMQYALAELDFDYLQLLSPSCLPIKPMEQFESHVAGPAEAHFDCVDLLGDQDALMSVGYRVLSSEHTWQHRLLRRLSNAYFGASAGRRDEAGIWLRSGRGRGLHPWLALLAIKALSRPSIGRHIFNEKFRPYYGTAWFGARRRLIAGMVEMFSRPNVPDYFSHVCIAEEFLIPSLLMHLKAVKGPMNHFIQAFDQAHPGKFDEEHMDQLRDSPAYFARKFADDPTAAVRLRVLDELVMTDSFYWERKAPPAFKTPGASPRPFHLTKALS
ncbi:MAG: hypothetical protein JWR60_4188 [Polaromonas sp.]|nr:hypothetical protein [Polaromonas sp.]